MISALIDGAIKRRKVVLGVTLIACVFGFLSYLAMPREAQPDIDLPYISVIVPFPGVSPEDAERLLVKPLEVQLQTIQGIKHMNALARQNAAIVTLEFEPDAPKQKALDDVRSKTDLARTLPARRRAADHPRTKLRRPADHRGGAAWPGARTRACAHFQELEGAPGEFARRAGSL